MQNRNVIIICRNRSGTVDRRRASLHGLLIWGSHVKQRYLVRRLSHAASTREIRARIEANVSMPEWIGGHRFGIFDLLNYVANGRRYVYDPGASPRFFDPEGIPSSTSVRLFDYLSRHGYSPINLDNFDGGQAQLRQELGNSPLAVAISATFLSTQEIESVIKHIRRVNRQVPIIMGSGVLLSKLDPNGRLTTEYERLISSNLYVILEEYGLDTLDLLLQKLSASDSLDPKSIPNIAYLKDHTVTYTERRYVPRDIDSDYPEWATVASIAKGVAFVRASQGCPFKCKFCTFPKASPSFMQRSVDSVRSELRAVHSAGIKHISFTDDHFATGPRRIKEICTMMLEEKLEFNWFAGIRASAITQENAQLLEETGCKVLCVGLESGDDRILKAMNKGTTAASNMRCLEILDRHHITAYGSFIVGFPGETEETFRNTINWINRSPLRLYKPFLFYLWPGSVIYDEQDQHDIKYFGDQYDCLLWKTPTMDALRASELLKGFILQVEKAALIYNYSPMYAFFPLLSKGYTMEDSLDFLRIRTELIKSELSRHSFLERRRFRTVKLGEIERLLKANEHLTQRRDDGSA